MVWNSSRMKIMFIAPLRRSADLFRAVYWDYAVFCLLLLVEGCWFKEAAIITLGGGAEQEQQCPHSGWSRETELMTSHIWAESFDTESPVMDDSREKNSKWKEKEKIWAGWQMNTKDGAPFLFFISEMCETHTNTLICLSEEKEPRVRNDSFWPRALIRSFAWVTCSGSPAGWYLPRYLWQGNRCAAQGRNHNEPCGFSAQLKSLYLLQWTATIPTNLETIQLQSPLDVSLHSQTWWKLMKPQTNHAVAPPRL